MEVEKKKEEQARSEGQKREGRDAEKTSSAGGGISICGECRRRSKRKRRRSGEEEKTETDKESRRNREILLSFGFSRNFWGRIGKKEKRKREVHHLSLNIPP